MAAMYLENVSDLHLDQIPPTVGYIVMKYLEELPEIQRWKKRGTRGTPSMQILSSCAIFFNFHTIFCKILRIFAQFCCVFEHFCKFLQIYAFFCSFLYVMCIFEPIFCANISS